MTKTDADASLKAAGLDEGGLPIHFPITVNEDGLGPTEPDLPHHRECWCILPSCVWTVALAKERADASTEMQRLREAMQDLIEDWCDCGDEFCTESVYRNQLVDLFDPEAAP